MIKKVISVTGLAILLVFTRSAAAYGILNDLNMPESQTNISKEKSDITELTSAEMNTEAWLSHISDEAYDVITANSSVSKWKKDGKIAFAINIYDDEWAKLQNQEEMILACQIPETLLEELSTPDLLKLVEEYPLLNNIYQETLEEGFLYICDSFNGLRELLDREDCAEVVYSEYVNLEIPQSSALEFGKHYTDEEAVAYVNKLLNDKELMKTARTELWPLVVSDLLEGILTYKTDSNNAELFTAAIQEKLEQKSTSELKLYEIESASHDNEVSLLFDSVLPSRPSDEPGNTYHYTDVFWNGVAVTAKKYYVPKKNTIAGVTIIMSDFENQGLEVIDLGYNSYNCHTYAWLKPISTYKNDYYYYTLDLVPAWKEEFYEELAIPSKKGDIVYSSGHSAVVEIPNGHNPIVTAKWAGGPVVKGPLDKGQYKIQYGHQEIHYYRTIKSYK